VSANKAEIEITASTARLPAALRTAMKMMQGFVASTTGLLSKSSKKKDIDELGIAKGAAIGGIASSFAVRGIDKMLDQVGDVLKFNEALTRFGIATRIGGHELANLGQSAREASTATGINALEVLRGERAYVDLAGASKASAQSMRLIAAASQATGADVSDMATVMYSLENALHVSGPEMEYVMGGIVNQSKDGTVHFQQMAQEIIALAPIYARFGRTGREGANELGAQLQIVRSGFKDSAEAAVGLKNMWRNLQLHSDKFEKAGVKIFDVDKDGHKKLRNVAVILKDISKSKLDFDPHALMKAFGRGESERAFRLLEEQVDKYRELEELGMRNGVIQQDLATYTESASGRMAVAFEKMKVAFAEALTPERLEQIVQGIESLTEAMGPLMDITGKIADGFGMIYNAGKKARKLISGGSEYQTSVEERAIMGLPDRRFMHGLPITPDEQRRADQTKSRIDAYNRTIGGILGSEKNDRPTDESIRKAIVAARTDMTGGPDAAHTPEEISAGKAGRAYLAERSDSIPESKYKRIEAKILAEQDSAQLQSRLGPLIDKMGKTISDAIDRARAPVVHVDGNPIARAANNAWHKRRKP